MNMMSSSPEILTISGRNITPFQGRSSTQIQPTPVQINNLTQKREYQQKGEDSVPSVEPAVPSEKGSIEDIEAQHISRQMSEIHINETDADMSAAANGNNEEAKTAMEQSSINLRENNFTHLD